MVLGNQCNRLHSTTRTYSAQSMLFVKKNLIQKRYTAGSTPYREFSGRDGHGESFLCAAGTCEFSVWEMRVAIVWATRSSRPRAGLLRLPIPCADREPRQSQAHSNGYRPCTGSVRCSSSGAMRPTSCTGSLRAKHIRRRSSHTALQELDSRGISSRHCRFLRQQVSWLARGMNPGPPLSSGLVALFLSVSSSLPEEGRSHLLKFWPKPSLGPLLPSRRVSQQLNENTSYHGTRLKVTMFSRVGVVEIGERHAVGSFVGEFIDG
jgi:hypothetical protein